MEGPIFDEHGVAYIGIHKSEYSLYKAAPGLAYCLEAMVKITCGTCTGDGDQCERGGICMLTRQAKAVLSRARGEQ